ncbi:hypothetical protein [Leptospirillum ferriphilum]|nr:hypothetical protein [Leptospirillum ferriphilum]
MECKSSGKVRNGHEDMRLLEVECEICGSSGWMPGTYPGVYICARCHRDIVSPHIHD